MQKRHWKAQAMKLLSGSLNTIGIMQSKTSLALINTPAITSIFISSNSKTARPQKNTTKAYKCATKSTSWKKKPN